MRTREEDERFKSLEREAMLRVIDALDSFMGRAPSPKHPTWRTVREARRYLADVRNGTIKELNDVK